MSLEVRVSCETLWTGPDVRSCPWVVCGLASGRSELLRVEAGEVGSGSHCGVCVWGQSARPGMCITRASRTCVSMARTCLPTLCLRCGAVLPLLGGAAGLSRTFLGALAAAAAAGIETHRTCMGQSGGLAIDKAPSARATTGPTSTELQYRLSSIAHTSSHKHTLKRLAQPTSTTATTSYHQSRSQ
jgi:hypothetical protein